jgi:macrophage erythroblast attacher
MVRTSENPKIVEAMQHAKKFLIPHSDTQSVEIQRAAGILAFPPGSDVDRYKVR